MRWAKSSPPVQSRVLRFRSGSTSERSELPRVADSATHVRIATARNSIVRQRKTAKQRFPHTFSSILFAKRIHSERKHGQGSNPRRRHSAVYRRLWRQRQEPPHH